MKIFINSYNRCTQNAAGGVQSKIFQTYNALKKKDIDVKLFDKWNDKLADCDIVHYFSLTAEYFFEIPYLKGMGKKIVLSSIVPLSGRNKIKLNIAADRFFKMHTLVACCKRILDMCDVIIAETSKERNFIIDAYNVDPSRIVVIPNGISPEVLGGDASLFRNTYNVSGDFVIQVGRIDRNKNLLSVIKALDGTDIPLYVIGGPAKGEEKYYDECKKTANDNVHFLGWIDHKDPMLRSALQAAKVLVLPSYQEIFGNAIFEALANGTNVVASNVLPVNEWGFSSAVETIDPYNIQDIRNKIQIAMAKDVDSEVKTYVNKEYSFDSIADKHIELYKSLLK